MNKCITQTADFLAESSALLLNNCKVVTPDGTYFYTGRRILGQTIDRDSAGGIPKRRLLGNCQRMGDPGASPILIFLWQHYKCIWLCKTFKE